MVHDWKEGGRGDERCSLVPSQEITIDIFLHIYKEGMHPIFLLGTPQLARDGLTLVGVLTIIACNMLTGNSPFWYVHNDSNPSYES